MAAMQRNQHALIVLNLPVSAGNLDSALGSIEGVNQNLAELGPLFCKVFRENSCRQRHRFFSDALVQVMWTNYIRHDQDYVINYLTELLNDSTKQGFAKVLLKDMHELASHLDFEVLPREVLATIAERRLRRAWLW